MEREESESAGGEGFLERWRTFSFGKKGGSGQAGKEVARDISGGRREEISFLISAKREAR